MHLEAVRTALIDVRRLGSVLLSARQPRGDSSQSGLEEVRVAARGQDQELGTILYHTLLHVMTLHQRSPPQHGVSATHAHTQSAYAYVPRHIAPEAQDVGDASLQPGLVPTVDSW